MGSAEGFTYDEAISACENQSAVLASTAELYAAWKKGLDKCRAGWLLDHSVRYPINSPRPGCGGGRVGVHTYYSKPNHTYYPEPHARFDAYCLRGKSLFTLILNIFNIFLKWKIHFFFLLVYYLQLTFCLEQIKLQ